MQCPRCAMSLIEAHRAGIPVDTCLGCGGVWLDRGELSRIAERLWALQHDWDTGEGPQEARMGWGRRLRYPRRDPRRRSGPIGFYR